MLDWKYFPHIFDCIYDNLGGDGLEAIRSACSSLRTRVKKDLWEDVTISHRILYTSSPGSAPRPEAVILSQTQLYSTRHGSALPPVYTNGHPTTKVVNLTHPPTRLCWYDRKELCQDRQRCPITLHLSAVSAAMGSDIVVQLLQADTYNCQDLDGAVYYLDCKALVTSQILRTSEEQCGLNYLYVNPVKENIFKLAYKLDARSDMVPLSVSGFSTSGHRDVTIVLHPHRGEGAGDSGQRASEGAPFDLSSLLHNLAEAGQEFKEILLVATDTWPPEGPFELRHPTPEISAATFAAVWPGCLERDERSSPTADRIQVISWPDARFMLGNTVCDLLMFEPSPLRFSQDGAHPWEASQS